MPVAELGRTPSEEYRLGLREARSRSPPPGRCPSARPSSRAAGGRADYQRPAAGLGLRRAGATAGPQDRRRDRASASSASEVTARSPASATIVWRGGGVNFAFVLSPNVLDQFPVSYLGLLQGRRRAPSATCSRRWSTNSPHLPSSRSREALEIFAAHPRRRDQRRRGDRRPRRGLRPPRARRRHGGRPAPARGRRRRDESARRHPRRRRPRLPHRVRPARRPRGRASPRVLGVVGTWAFVELVLEIDFSVDPAGDPRCHRRAPSRSTIAVGIATTWSALSVKPARFLREE